MLRTLTTLILFSCCALHAGDATTEALAKIREAVKNDDAQIYRWKFFDSTETLANVRINMLKLDGDRFEKAMKYLEEKVKPALPEKDWLALKDRLKRLADSRLGRGAFPSGDTHGSVFRYGETSITPPFDALWLTFKSPKARTRE
jgi:hypothetical protein